MRKWVRSIFWILFFVSLFFGVSMMVMMVTTLSRISRTFSTFSGTRFCPLSCHDGSAIQNPNWGRFVSAKIEAENNWRNRQLINRQRCRRVVSRIGRCHIFSRAWSSCFSCSSQSRLSRFSNLFVLSSRKDVCNFDVKLKQNRFEL